MGTVHFASHDAVATLTIDNEARYNAMSLSMWEQLGDRLAAIEGDSAIRAVVLRGIGDKAFVSGADISEFDSQRSGDEAVAHYNAMVDRAQGALQRLRCPVIAAISGICYGGGIGLALACDLRYAAPTARFRMPAARLGLGYGRAGLARMSAVMGVAAASEIFYTARVQDARAAVRLGLVHSVHDDVFCHAAGVAADIAANAPLTIAAAKLGFRSILDPGDVSAAAVSQAVDRCFASADYAEGRAAFKDKRTPGFTGR